MIEVYSFHVMFALQILLLSVLHPTRLLRNARRQMAHHAPGQFPHLYPDGEASAQRRLRIYRLVNTIIAVGGVVLLGLLFSYMQQADWDDGPVETAVLLYFMLQMLPLVLYSRSVARFHQLLRNMMPDEKKRAVLQRRSLFDFISPAPVIGVVLCYPLFAALVVYIQRDPFEGFAGYLNIGFVSLLYAWTAYWVYRTLYGRKTNPLQSHADRMHEIGKIVKICVYSCLAGVLFLMLNFTLVLLDMQSVEPFATSLFLVVCALLSYEGLNAASDEPAAGGPQLQFR